MLHKCLLAIVITFKGPLSLTGRDVSRIETRIPAITTDKIIHFLEVMAKKSQNFALTAVNLYQFWYIECFFGPATK